jgi:hypothetical protein
MNHHLSINLARCFQIAGLSISYDFGITLFKAYQRTYGLDYEMSKLKINNRKVSVC